MTWARSQIAVPSPLSAFFRRLFSPKREIFAASTELIAVVLLLLLMLTNYFTYATFDNHSMNVYVDNASINVTVDDAHTNISVDEYYINVTVDQFLCQCYHWRWLLVPSDFAQVEGVDA